MVHQGSVTFDALGIRTANTLRVFQYRSQYSNTGNYTGMNHSINSLIVYVYRTRT